MLAGCQCNVRNGDNCKLLVMHHTSCYCVYFCYIHLLKLLLLFLVQDDALAQVRSVTSQIKDLEEERERTENRLQVLQKSLGDAEEGASKIQMP